MSMSEEQLGDILLVRLTGRLDSYSSTELEAGLLERAANNPRLVLDFTRLEFISSAGLRIILMAAKRARQANHRFALYGLSDSIHKVFAVSGFLKILNVFPTQEEARAFAAG